MQKIDNHGYMKQSKNVILDFLHLNLMLNIKNKFYIINLYNVKHYITKVLKPQAAAST